MATGVRQMRPVSNNVLLPIPPPPILLGFTIRCSKLESLTHAAISISPCRCLSTCTTYTQLQNYVPCISHWRHSSNSRRSLQSKTSLRSTGYSRIQMNRHWKCSEKFSGSLGSYIITNLHVQFTGNVSTSKVSQLWTCTRGTDTALRNTWQLQTVRSLC